MDENCKERHQKLDTKIEDLDKRLKNLELFQVRFETKIESLCKKIDSLITSIRGASVFILTTLVLFFIWYIQSLPRG